MGFHKIELTFWKSVSFSRMEANLILKINMCTFLLNHVALHKLYSFVVVWLFLKNKNVINERSITVVTIKNTSGIVVRKRLH